MKLKDIGPYLQRITLTAASWQPLTLRGAAALILAAFALQTLAFTEHDLAANLIGVATLGAIAVFCLVGIFLKLRLRRTISARCRFDELHSYSKAAVPSGIVLENCSVLPFFEVNVERNFARSGVATPLHIVKGSDRPARRRYLIDSNRFPHRGLWTLRSLKMRLSDIAGLVRLTWELPAETSVEIAAPTIAIRPLPILVSSARAGDEISHSQERSGDPFDMKMYDPSDGVKRIMWKVYARSQQLVVRRPEPAVIPEGELALYMVASAEEDHVAGALQGYLEQLEEEQITVLFGTDGMALPDVPPDTHRAQAVIPGQQFCSGSAEIKRAIIHSVWSELAGSGKGFGSFLNSLIESNRMMQRVVVFGPARSDWLETIAAGVSHAGVAVTAVVVPDEFQQLIGSPGDAISGRGAITGLIRPSELRRIMKSLGQGARQPAASIDATAARLAIELIRCERR